MASKRLGTDKENFREVNIIDAKISFSLFKQKIFLVWFYFLINTPCSQIRMKDKLF